MSQCSGEERTRIELSPKTHPTWSVLCWGTNSKFWALVRFAQTSTRRSFKVAKPDVNVEIWPDSLTYLFTCGIIVEALTKRILNLYDRKSIYLLGGDEFLSWGTCKVFVSDRSSLLRNGTLFRRGWCARRTIHLNASHTERAVLGNKPNVFWPWFGLRKCLPVGRQKLPNMMWMLRYALTRRLISSHVGSVLKCLSAYWTSVIGNLANVRIEVLS